MIERAFGKVEALFQRGDDLGAAGVAGEPADRVAPRADPGEDAGDPLRHILLDEGRNRAVEDNTEAGILDVPSHDPERVRP